MSENFLVKVINMSDNDPKNWKNARTFFELISFYQKFWYIDIMRMLLYFDTCSDLFGPFLTFLTTFWHFWTLFKLFDLFSHILDPFSTFSDILRFLRFSDIFCQFKKSDIFTFISIQIFNLWYCLIFDENESSTIKRKRYRFGNEFYIWRWLRIRNRTEFGTVIPKILSCL